MSRYADTVSRAEIGFGVASGVAALGLMVAQAADGSPHDADGARVHFIGDGAVAVVGLTAVCMFLTLLEATVPEFGGTKPLFSVGSILAAARLCLPRGSAGRWPGCSRRCRHPGSFCFGRPGSFCCGRLCLPGPHRPPCPVLACPRKKTGHRLWFRADPTATGPPGFCDCDGAGRDVPADGDPGGVGGAGAVVHAGDGGAGGAARGERDDAGADLCAGALATTKACILDQVALGTTTSRIFLRVRRRRPMTVSWTGLRQRWSRRGWLKAGDNRLGCCPIRCRSLL